MLLGTAAVPIVRGASAKGLGIPVRAYLVVISAMTVVGWATGNWLIMLGATAFIISDSILGWANSSPNAPGLHVAIMVTYHTAIVSLSPQPVDLQPPNICSHCWADFGRYT